jgi:hypothetical protein
MKGKFPLLFIIAFVIISVTGIKAAVPPPPPTTATTPPCWPPPCIPIDGGISFLVVAGAAYAGKKLYDKRKKENSNSLQE